jgi:predicted amidohydrolase YtcJ
MPDGSASAVAPELVLLGGDVHAFDMAGTRASAIAIGHGRILSIGSDEEIAALTGQRTLVERLSGSVVVPGLIDGHNHLLSTGVELGEVLLYNCRSIREIVDRIAARVQTCEPGDWVLGRGWDESLLDERRHPTRLDLDPISPDNPVVINRVWNRLVANSAALAACRISSETPDPAPGLYEGGFERDGGGEPTGLFRDGAKALVLEHAPVLDELARVAAIERACRAYSEVGIVGVAEPGLYPYELHAFDRARHEGRLTVRTDLLLAGWGWARAAGWSTGPPLPEETLAERIEGLGVGDGFGDDMLRIGGVKLLPDGGVGDRTARLYEPYLGEPENRGSWVIEPDELRRRILWIHDAGFSIDSHTCGDEAQEAVVRAYAEAQERNPKPWLRHRVHHAYLPTPAVLRVMSRHRIGAFVSSPFLALLGESFVASLGEVRAARMMPMRTYLDAGVPLVGSSDSPVADYVPWVGIQAAVTRTTVAGRMLGAEERLTVTEAIRSYTLDAARALGVADRRGSLEPGKLADLVVLDRDPFATAPEDLGQVRPVATMLGGTWVYDAR